MLMCANMTPITHLPGLTYETCFFQGHPQPPPQLPTECTDVILQNIRKCQAVILSVVMLKAILHYCFTFMSVAWFRKCITYLKNQILRGEIGNTYTTQHVYNYKLCTSSHFQRCSKESQMDN